MRDKIFMKTKRERSKGCHTGRNHIIITAIVEGEREQDCLKKEIKKAVRKLKRLSDGTHKVTFDSYISIRNSNHPGE